MAEACRHSVDVVVQVLTSVLLGGGSRTRSAPCGASSALSVPQVLQTQPGRVHPAHTQGKMHVVCTNAQVNACLKSFQHHTVWNLMTSIRWKLIRLFDHQDQLLAERKPHLRYSGSASTCLNEFQHSSAGLCEKEAGYRYISPTETSRGCIR